MHRCIPYWCVYATLHVSCICVAYVGGLCGALDMPARRVYVECVQVGCTYPCERSVCSVCVHGCIECVLMIMCTCVYHSGVYHSCIYGYE